MREKFLKLAALATLLSLGLAASPAEARHYWGHHHGWHHQGWRHHGWHRHVWHRHGWHHRHWH